MNEADKRRWEVVGCDSRAGVVAYRESVLVEITGDDSLLMTLEKTAELIEALQAAIAKAKAMADG
jgi:hypothetical protein